MTGGHAPEGAPPGSGSAAGRHLAALTEALPALHRSLGRLESWGARLAADLPAGARLLAAGNGGSAAEAQHLTAELVGRYRSDRPPMSAIALHAETSSVTAIANDYGADEVFARQIRGHGRRGDYLLVLSTSGRSPNVVRAAEVAASMDLTVWALTGPSPNRLAGLADEVVAIDAPDPAVVQELHLVALHLVCEALDACLAEPSARGAASARPIDPHPAAPGGHRARRRRDAREGAVP